ncbi:unnamed protein product [Prorocentrum cordatum]|uniref:VWFA domain-containing protein n=1 Tax=Prorocentrum cordatum TaxID=2364126 RepID=A0ABN9X321_9DINO|nr:unnamed protein product [Polarella glacialis]
MSFRMAPNMSELNAKILERCEEEDDAGINWSDSDVSESERANCLGQLRGLKEVSTSQRILPPVHVVLALDTSKSMERRDVDGGSRSQAVLKACRKFLEEQSASQHKAEDRYSLLAFSRDAVVHFKRLSLSACRDQLLHCPGPKLRLEARFSAAFKGIMELIREGQDSLESAGAPEDVQVVMCSGGQSVEPAGSVENLLEVGLLAHPCVQNLRGFAVHTVGFGSGNRKLRLFPGGYCQGLEISETGIVTQLSQNAQNLGLNI